MNTPEVLLLILAIVLFVCSFILVDKDKKTQGRYGANQGSKENIELSKQDIKELREQIDTILTDAVSNAVIDADDKLSKISNEKIMAVHDFSNQLLAKIEQNNSEVVFLFNMLTQKEEEIKATFLKMETIRRENKEFLEKVTAMVSNKNKAKEQAEKKDTAVNAMIQKVSPDKREDKEKRSNQAELMDVEDLLSEIDAVSSFETSEYNRNDEILRLYKNKKSILEISKQLNMGQGEVKLVVDLYAKKE